MNKSWNICFMEISRLMKRPQTYLLMFAMPLFFTLIFGSMLNASEEEKMKIMLVDEDQTSLSQSFYDQLRKGNHLFELELGSQDEASQMLESKEIPGVIVIKEGFQAEMLQSGTTLVGFQKIPEWNSSATITSFLANKLSKMKIEVKASEKWSEYSSESWEVMYSGMEKQNQAPLDIRQVNMDSTKSAGQIDGMSARASGFAIMFVMIMMMSVTGTILEARKNGVWYRLLTTPASKWEIAVGYLLSFFLIGWIQFGILILSTHYLFAVQWGNPISIAILVSALLLAIVGLGLLIAGMVKTVEQQASIGNLIVVATCMISGVYWPLEIEPVFMQKIAQFLPQTWAMKGFTEIMASGGSIIHIVDNTSVLLGFALVFLVFGVRKIRFE
jgi:ABC-2 type transport system permease protein